MCLCEKKNTSSLWSINNASLKHAPDIALVHTKVFDVPWDEFFLKKLLQQPTNLSFVANHRPEDKVKGFLLGSIVFDEAEILSLAVDNLYQGQSMGQALLSEFIKTLKERKARAIFLEVSAKNGPAQNFYQNFGFQIIGHRKNYYHQKQEPPQDALLLSLSLLDHV